MIVDVVGIEDTLYFESPRYLAPDGVFLLGGKMDLIHDGGGLLGILSFLVVLYLRMHRPVVLGGTRRTLLFHSGNVNQDSMQHLPDLVKNGHLRGVVDSEWAMEDALKVRAPLSKPRLHALTRLGI